MIVESAYNVIDLIVNIISESLCKRNQLILLIEEQLAVLI